MITFEEAKQIVLEKRGGLYPEGDFRVLATGWETAERWIVNYASEAVDNRPVLSVDKATGEYFEDYGVPGDNNPFPDKTPVG